VYTFKRLAVGNSSELVTCPYELFFLTVIGTTTQWRTQDCFFLGGGGSKNSFEGGGQRERGSVGRSPLVGVSGGSRNLVQEISFRIVKFS